MSLEIDKVTKRFADYVALADVSLKVAAGELVALLGPSGCGKTTLLRVLAGLEIPDAGAVTFDGEDVTHVAPADRNVGLVFQHYALFEHMTVFENVAFALRVRGTAAVKTRARVAELVERVRLSGLSGRLPSQLSGGQRQRVALARALAAEPRVLLLDEPFGALDARVRQELRAWLRHLHNETRLTTVLVTHDRQDAFEVADRVAIMNAGRIAQIDAPGAVFHNPASAWVMRFLGDVNELPADGSRPSGSVAFVRPHEFDVTRSRRDPSSYEGRVQRLYAAGAVVRVEVQAAALGRDLIVEIDEQRFIELGLQRGETVFVSPRRVRTFETD